ncbi:thioredoxin domain-containing protein [bacterium]|jgi:uncharacterized protein|nr:thioredoxin domain-containing protein [bacterium]
MTRQSLPSPEAIGALPRDGGPEFNRLIFESSPYLTQHARNPVNWYAWNKEAWDLARMLNKPVFLSVGYATCHWCHVMENECFADQEVADVLNKHFICIKVDREERPDLDEIYMTVTQLMTQQGGWPNSLWLLPDMRPWFAGTYFPKEDVAGRPGFLSVLDNLLHAWTEQPEEVEQQAVRLTRALHEMNQHQEREGESSLRQEVVDTALMRTLGSFDPQWGGQRGAPKFPPHHTMELWLQSVEKTGNMDHRNALTKTLHTMANGGMYDHVGGGFHRYSTDEEWRLPHFEKMLYDNAQLITVYSKAYALTKDERYQTIVSETIDWLCRDMMSPQGGFYSGLDADSEGEEGTYYIWSDSEGKSIAGDQYEQWAKYYDIRSDGNITDEATQQPIPSNVWFVQTYDAEIAAQLRPLKPLFLKERYKREAPFTDTKIIAAWNGLMIEALATAGSVFQKKEWIDQAVRTASWLRETMWVSDSLYRIVMNEKVSQKGYLDDYMSLAKGLLCLSELTQDSQWRDFAATLMDQANDRFKDDVNGGYYLSEDSHGGLLRPKDWTDKAEPNPNGVALQVLSKMGRIPEALDHIKAGAHWIETQSIAVLTTVSGLWDTLESVRINSKKDTSNLSEWRVVQYLEDGLDCVVEISLPKGSHVLASESGMVWTSEDAAIQIAPNYPSGKRLKVEYQDQAPSILEGTVQIPVTIKWAADCLELDQITITQTLNLCTETACQPAVQETVSLPTNKFLL